MIGRGLKVKVIGQGQCRGLGYNAVDPTSIEGSCFRSVLKCTVCGIPDTNAAT